ncbi:MAG: glycosyltransferase [Microbacterium sp.]
MGKTVIYDAHEDLPVQVRNKPYLHPIAIPFMVGAAHVIVALTRMANHVVAATEAIAARYRIGHVTVVHNYPPIRTEDTSSESATARELSVVYIGGIGTLRGADVMIDALASPIYPAEWRMNIAGVVAEPLLKHLSQKAGWARVDFFGQVPPIAARDLLLSSRVGLVLFQNTDAHRESLPTKMFEYFAAGIPVIASDFPLWREIIGKHECGQLVDQTSPEAVALAVRRYAEDPDLLARHAKNARKLALTELNWENEARRLVEVYQDQVDQSGFSNQA